MGTQDRCPGSGGVLGLLMDSLPSRGLQATR